MDGLFRAHLAAQHLNRAIGDDFIGIHIGLSARACLPHDQREVVIQLAVYDFLSGFDDDLTQVLIHFAELHIGERGSLFDDAERFDNR
jgi:hypothetical protein